MGFLRRIFRSADGPLCVKITYTRSVGGVAVTLIAQADTAKEACRAMEAGIEASEKAFSK